MPREAPPYGATLEEPRQLPQVLLNQPVLVARDWLPEGVFPELDELREEHHRLLDEVFAERSECIRIRDEYEKEDEDRANALAVGEEPPAITGSAERQDTLSEAQARMWAGWDRVAEFVGRAAEVIMEKGGVSPLFSDEPGLRLSKWRQQFAATRTEAAQEVEAAKALVAKAERKAADVDQVEMWLDRTVKPRGGRYLSAPQLGAPFPTQSEREAKQVSPALSGTGMVN